jgi:hypothetical protein
MKIRAVNRERREILKPADLKRELDKLSYMGYEALIDHVQMYIQSSQSQFLQEMEKAQAYDVLELQTKEAILDSMDKARFRQSSHRRFQCLLDLLPTEDDTLPDDTPSYKCFEVTGKFKNPTTDLVCLFENGSFASTCPFFASFGMPVISGQCFDSVIVGSMLNVTVSIVIGIACCTILMKEPLREVKKSPTYIDILLASLTILHVFGIMPNRLLLMNGRRKVMVR